MAKNKKPKKRKSRRSPPKSIRQISPKLRHILYEILKTIIGIISIVISLIIFWPRITIDTGEPLDPREPFSTPFVIKNEGYILSYSIFHSLSCKRIELKNKIVHNYGQVHEIDDNIPRLRPNESTTISIQHTFRQPPDYVVSAEIYIDLFCYVSDGNGIFDCVNCVD
jgi:hypothetical protein